MGAPRGTPYERVMRNVIEDENGCLIWQGATNENGRYGRINVQRRPVGVHRVVYEAVNGPTPDGYEVDHTCRVTLCVNENHLEAVTKAVNRERQAKALRSTMMCKRGKHTRTAKNRVMRPDGREECRLCQRERARERYIKRVQAS